MTQNRIHPIVLFVYARPDHTAQVLEGLRANNPPLLYVFSDGPRSEEKRAAVNEVRRLVRDIDWTEVRLTEREENFGLAKSIVGGVSEVLEQHETVIVLEDDCVPEPQFYSVMSSLLAYYREEPKVFSISGYGFPIPIPSDYPYSHYFLPRISSWGWATWKDRWKHFSWNFRGMYEELQNSGTDITIVGNDPALRFACSDETLDHRRDIWTPGWMFAALLANAYTAWPVRSLVQNIGWDESGENCKVNKRFDVSDRLWGSSNGIRLSMNVEVDPRILSSFRKFRELRTHSRFSGLFRMLKRIC